jgi:hypothetical protein
MYVKDGKKRICAELCFPSETRVVMADGTRVSIDSIQEGDMVISHTGNRREVVRTMSHNHVGSLTCIKVMGLPQTLKSTPEHPYFVMKQNEYCACGCDSKLKTAYVQNARASYSAKYVAGHNPQGTKVIDQPSFKFEDACKIRSGDILAIPIPQGEVKTDTTENEAELLGWFLAEGSYVKRHGNR